MHIQLHITLNNGVKMPMLGFGTFKIPDGEVVIQSVRKALESGYRHIDTAAYYKNEIGVGEGIRQSGVARSEIFLTDFHIHHLESLLVECQIRPMVNQIEFHPRLLQTPLFEYCKKQHIQYEAYSPLMQGKIFNIPLLAEMAEKYGRTVAQIVLRWNIQMGVVTIPKSTHPERILENMRIFDFEISEEDIQSICSLDKGQRVGHDPDRRTK